MDGEVDSHRWILVCRFVMCSLHSVALFSCCMYQCVSFTKFHFHAWHVCANARIESQEVFLTPVKILVALSGHPLNFLTKFAL